MRIGHKLQACASGGKSCKLAPAGEIEREFLSSKLIRKVNSDELSSDPIVKAQDTNLKWLDSLKVKKINSKRYNVYRFNFYDKKYEIIKLKVAKKKDKYIIDDIIF